MLSTKHIGSKWRMASTSPMASNFEETETLPRRDCPLNVRLVPDFTSFPPGKAQTRACFSVPSISPCRCYRFDGAGRGVVLVLVIAIAVGRARRCAERGSRSPRLTLRSPLDLNASLDLSKKASSRSARVFSSGPRDLARSSTALNPGAGRRCTCASLRFP